MDKDMARMAREAKAARDAAGEVDVRADAQLALYEMGVNGWAALHRHVPTEELQSWIADPSTIPPKIRTRAMAEATDTSDRNVDDRTRRGGQAAANQFGTFTVHTASDKQVAYIKRLLGERDLTGITVPEVIDGISKTGASALIDRLLGRPMAAASAPAAAPAARLASDKQMGFLKRLIAERDYFSLVPADRTKVDFVNGGGVPTAKGASALIDVLTGTAYAPKAQQPVEAPLELGMYRKADGTLYRVYPGRESGRLLAKRLILPEVAGDKATFEYAGLASRFVSADERMTLDEAKAFGHQFGICCVCGALLTDPESVERGIGPVCGSRI